LSLKLIIHTDIISRSHSDCWDGYGEGFRPVQSRPGPGEHVLGGKQGEDQQDHAAHPDLLRTGATCQGADRYAHHN